jgi:hypothetical protein
MLKDEFGLLNNEYFMQVDVNYIALLVAVIANIALGFVWYGPLFGKSWMHMTGLNMETINANKAKGMGTSYGLMTLGSILMAYVLYHVMVFGAAFTNTSGVTAGLSAAIWAWLGFVAPVTLGTVLWDGKPWKLWFINAGYYFVALILMGIIFGSFPM